MQQATSQQAKPVRGPHKPAPTGIEGREEEFGKAVSALVKTFADRVPYAHEFNDALVKSHLSHLEFVRQHNLVDEFIEHDMKTMRPILTRVAQAIELTGDREQALVGMFDGTACHYQLVKETVEEPGARSFPCPYTLVLEQGGRIGQFSFTIEDIHELWCKPRYYGFAREMNVAIEVSDCHGDWCTVRLLDDGDKVPVQAPRGAATA